MQTLRRSAIWALLLLAAGEPIVGQTTYTPYTFGTLAGAARGSVDGAGTAARFDLPDDVAVDRAGNLYVADVDNFTVRKIAPDGDVTTLAGKAGVRGSADGIGTSARFYFPLAVAVDGAGNVYVVDSGSSFDTVSLGGTIRKITPDGMVTTLAGTAGLFGSADGAGGSARFNYPDDIAVDGFGNLYVTDTDNYMIRKITADGTVTTFAGAAGIRGTIDGTGSAARFWSPGAVTVDTSGNVFVIDSGGIRKITPGGVVTTLPGTAAAAGVIVGGLAVDSAGNLYIGTNYSIQKLFPDGTLTSVAGTVGVPGTADGTGVNAQFYLPGGIAVDGASNVFVADEVGTIRKVTPSGVVITFAGAPALTGNIDATGAAAGFYRPEGVAVDGSGNILVADTFDQTIRRITPAGVVSTLAGAPSVGGSADGTGANARFEFPAGIAADSAGNAYVADTGNSTVRKVTPQGVVTTIAGAAGAGGTSDGTGPSARFSAPAGIAVDGAGNLYVADQDNYTIRKITPAGVVTTLAGSAGQAGSVDGTGASARFIRPAGIAADNAGNIYVGDAGLGVIRKITVNGVVTTLAGQFSNPFGVAVDRAGSVYVADYGGNTIRRITSDGMVTTLGGTQGIAGCADGIGPSAQFNGPYGIAVDPAGILYVADTGNSVIRKGIQIVNTPPAITTQTVSQTIASGSTVVFSASASSPAIVNYQWFLNNVAISQATGPRIVISGVTSANAGSYTLVASNSAGSTTSNAATLTIVPTANPGRLVNGSVLTGIRGTLTLGFMVSGSGTAGSQNLLIRATGPALTTFGVTGVLPDPKLTVIRQSDHAALSTNVGWGSPATNQAEVTAADNATGAFPLSNSASLDSALVNSFQSVTGGYTVQVNGKSGDSGNALVEVFDDTPIYTLMTPRLVNLSCLNQVSAGGILTAGFVIGGATAKTVLVRASGPSLVQFGVTGVMPDPQLTLNSTSAAAPGVVATNAGWGGDPQIMAAGNSVEAFAFTNPSSLDSALLLSLAPGPYTVQVSSVSGASGNVLVEVYDVP